MNDVTAMDLLPYTAPAPGGKGANSSYRLCSSGTRCGMHFLRSGPSFAQRTRKHGTSCARCTKTPSLGFPRSVRGRRGSREASRLRRNGFLRSTGIRGDVRMQLLRGGIAFEDRPRSHAAVSGGVFVGF